MTVSSESLVYNQEKFIFNFPKQTLGNDEFYEICMENPHLKLERNPDGTVIIMPNTGGKTGKRNTKLTTRLSLWEEENGGNTFDSSTAFIFPNGATRSPDVAWVSDAQWNSLTDSEQEKFPPISPEFVEIGRAHV